MTPQVRILELSSHACANDACVNRLGEGAFCIVEFRTGVNVGDGTGLIRLLLCAPCAIALNDFIDQEGEAL
jgi:hypothetical protein